MKYAKLGSVSTGTMRLEDLVPAFMSALDNIDAARATALEGQWADVFDTLALQGELHDSAVECVDAFMNALCDYAPPYSYFGAHGGDGAGFGFWPSWETLAEDDYALRQGPVLRVDAGSEWPRPLPEGIDYVLEVTDHGNATLKDLDGKEIWSVV